MELKIERLSKTYPNGVHALREVSLAIPRGMYGLLGPNGAGKSTLMRILATLQEADSGAVTFDGIDVLRQKDELRRTLGYLPQEFGLYPKVQAEEMLDHFALLKGIGDRRERRAVVRGLLEQTNLWDARDKKLGGFSGGMRQRFGIAVALLGNPRLIIVDEPTAGLDPAERVRFLNLLSELGENAVVLLSTHIVEDVSELCSRMAIINRGQILLEAEPLAAIAALRGRVWRRVVARESLAAFEAAHPVISTKLLSGRTVIHVVDDRQPDDSFEPVEPDLEDVYFSTMRGIPLHRAPAVPIDVVLPPEPAAAGAPVDAVSADPSVDAVAADPPEVDPSAALDAPSPRSITPDHASNAHVDTSGATHAVQGIAITPSADDGADQQPPDGESANVRTADPENPPTEVEAGPTLTSSAVSAVSAAPRATSPEAAHGEDLRAEAEAPLPASEDAVGDAVPLVPEGATLPLFSPAVVPGAIAEPEPAPQAPVADGEGASAITDLPDQLPLFDGGAQRRAADPRGDGA
ncbi:MAG TPA: ATP-binding cassette domain-containing protein [Longimicrobiaceae bacterium]|nr:ATP-binding cassette domain-containing protein [Longimicrobiaceae bacterium]